MYLFYLVIDNPKLALDFMTELRGAGVDTSIEDYGSGLSSLSYLRTVTAQEQKIDKMFVQDMANCNSAALLVKATIYLAHNLGAKIAAEGVALLRAMAPVLRRAATLPGRCRWTTF